MLVSVEVYVGVSVFVGVNVSVKVEVEVAVRVGGNVKLAVMVDWADSGISISFSPQADSVKNKRIVIIRKSHNFCRCCFLIISIFSVTLNTVFIFMGK